MWEVRGLVHWWSLGRDSVARVSWWCSALAEVKVMVDMPSSAAAEVFSARSSMKSTCSGAASMIQAPEAHDGGKGPVEHQGGREADGGDEGEDGEKPVGATPG